MRRLKFQTSEGFEFQFDVSDDDTLHNIKHKIRRHYGFATSSYTLIFDDVAIYTDAELLAALRRLADGSLIRLHILPTSERPLPSQASTSNFTIADSDAVSLPEIDASLEESPSERAERPLPAISNEASNSARADSDAVSLLEIDASLDDSPSERAERSLPAISNEASNCRADPDGVSMPEAGISSETLSSFNGDIIGKAADLDMADEAPTKPSSSGRSEQPEQPSTSEQPSPMITVSTKPAPPQPANPGDMTVWLTSGAWRKAITVHEDADVRQIRSAIIATYNVRVPDEIKFVLNRCFVVEEDESFKSQRIKNNDDIEFLASDELRAQFIQDFEYQAAAAEAQAQAALPFEDVLDDVTILTVTVKHGEARTEVEVLPGQKVGYLKLKLAEINFPLPAKRYGFLHGTFLLNERLSFAGQGVSDGDEIKIVY